MEGSYGLSERYKDKAPIEVARARLDQEALSGKTVLVPDTAHDDRLRYPDKVAAEGIRTILSRAAHWQDGVHRRAAGLWWSSLPLYGG